jgi:hypothetical protein
MKIPISALIGSGALAVVVSAVASPGGVGAEKPAAADPMHHNSLQDSGNADSIEASCTAGAGTDGGAA